MPGLPHLAGIAATVVAHFDLAAGEAPENIAVEPDGSADLTFASPARSPTSPGAETSADASPCPPSRTRTPPSSTTRSFSASPAPTTALSASTTPPVPARPASGASPPTAASPSRSQSCPRTGCPTAWPSTSTETCCTRPTRCGESSGACPWQEASAPRGHGDGSHPAAVRNRLRRRRHQGPRRRRMGVQHRPRDGAAHPRTPKRLRRPDRDPGDRARRYRRLRVHLTPR